MIENEQYGSGETRIVREFKLTGPDRAVDGIREKDLARRMAIVLIPGVVNGVITQEAAEGTWETDFDDRVYPCYPRVRFYPREIFID